MNSYKEFMRKVKNDKPKPTNGGKKYIKKTINSSKWRLILSTITILFLIVPTFYMLTFVYYAFGTKSTTLMEVASKTLYITETNIIVVEMEFDMTFSVFSMKLSFEQYKQIGDDFYPAKKYDLQFILDDLVKKEEDSKLEKIYPKYPTQTNQWFVHPNQGAEFYSSKEWRVLAGLPEETVVEAYISLSELYTVKEVVNKMENIDVTWAAIYTGTEDKMLSNDGYVVSPIGYPVQYDVSTWSPFRESNSHEDI